IFVYSTAGTVQTVTYTSINSTQFLGCSGGSGQIMRGYAVGRQTSNAGINHTTQADPKNYLIQAPGTKNLTIEKCLFKQAYGDFIWLGTSSTDHTSWSTNARIMNCDGDMACRNAVTLGSGVNGAIIENCKFTNIRSQAIDGEPGN